MAKMEEVYSFEGKLIRNTAKAILIEVNGIEMWFPLSQIHDPEEFFDSDSVLQKGNKRVTVSAWIAKEKGLI